MSIPQIITKEEREARRNSNPAPTGTKLEQQPIAQFRVKGGCRTCKPIPVYAKPTVDQPQ